MGAEPVPAVVTSPGAPADHGVIDHGATAAVTALYQANALSMIRLAHADVPPAAW